MIVAEVMTQTVRTCSPSDTLRAAARIMWEQDCGSVPVVADDGQLVGMITDRDICMAAYLRGQSLHECVVGDIMAKPAIVCRPGDPIEKAELAMREHRVRRLAVVDEADRVTGLLSLNDVVLAAPNTGNERQGMHPAAVLATLAGICRHRAHHQPA